jgi:voltage-gated potassium channel Kch/predicted hydrocarbon binding protein
LDIETAMRSRFLSLLWSPGGLTLLILAFIILAATAAYMALEGWDFLTSLVFTLATITTIGYGNVVPSTRPAWIFTASLMILTLSVLAVALSTYASRLIHLVARGVNPMEQNQRALASLDDHLVITAESGFASMLAHDLRAKEMPFAAITEDEDLHSRWLDEAVPTVLGNPDDEDILRRAGIERAAGFIVALASDADNVFVVLSAHDLNPHLRIVARAHTASSIPKLRRSGADEVILPEQITAINLVNLFRDHGRIGAVVSQVTDQLRQSLRVSSSLPTDQHAWPQHILFRALRLALQELSPDMERTLHALGEEFGRDAVAPNLSPGGLCRALDDLPRLWSAAGLGTIRVATCTEESAVLEETHCATCENMPAVGRAVCNLERGVITGALQARLGRTVRTQEAKCWGLGDRLCQFDITADPDTH